MKYIRVTAKVSVTTVTLARHRSAQRHQSGNAWRAWRCVQCICRRPRITHLRDHWRRVRLLWRVRPEGHCCVRPSSRLPRAWLCWINWALWLPQAIYRLCQWRCHGGGFEQALVCDILIVAESAVFALPGASCGGVALGDGFAQAGPAERTETDHVHASRIAAGFSELRRRSGICHQGSTRYRSCSVDSKMVQRDTKGFLDVDPRFEGCGHAGA